MLHGQLGQALALPEHRTAWKREQDRATPAGRRGKDPVEFLVIPEGDGVDANPGRLARRRGLSRLPRRGACADHHHVDLETDSSSAASAGSRSRFPSALARTASAGIGVSVLAGRWAR
jgi:hypothetical protein